MSKTMELVIIESPYKGDRARNLRYLRACIRDCLKRGESAFASHRMFTDALDDDIPEERTLGIEAGLAWAHVRQPVFDGDPGDGRILKYKVVCHVFYVDLGYTNGMNLAKARYDDEGVLHEERTLPPDDPFFLEPAFIPDTPEKAWIRGAEATRKAVADDLIPGSAEIERADILCIAIPGYEPPLAPENGRSVGS